jgi:hypothetical protein
MNNLSYCSVQQEDRSAPEVHESPQNEFVGAPLDTSDESTVFRISRLEGEARHVQDILNFHLISEIASRVNNFVAQLTNNKFRLQLFNKGKA